MILIEKELKKELKNKYDFYNQKFFNNELCFVFFNFGGTFPGQMANALYHKESDRAQINIDSNILKYELQDIEQLWNTLLHEMIHIFLEKRDITQSNVHGEAFINKANLIGKRMQLKSISTIEEASKWPIK